MSTALVIVLSMLAVAAFSFCQSVLVVHWLYRRNPRNRNTPQA